MKPLNQPHQTPRLPSACLGGFAIALALTASAAATDEPLAPELAFVPTATRIDARTVEVKYQIAPDHYMYRERFLVQTDPAIKASKPNNLPKGRVKNDPTFGRVETYHHSVRLRLTGLASATTANPAQAALKVTSQGCAEIIGICYPPMTHQFQWPKRVGDAVVGTPLDRDADQPAAAIREPATSDAGTKTLKDMLRAPPPKRE